MRFVDGSRIYLIILCVLAFILNLVVLPYVIYKSNMLSRSFKILMVTFCVANVCHNLIDAIAAPRIFQRPGFAFIFSEVLSPVLSKLSVVSLMAIFSIQIYNEFLHFLYRYLVLCRPRLAQFLTPINVSLLLIVTVPLYAAAQGYLISMIAGSLSYQYQFELNEELGYSLGTDAAGLVFLYWDSNSGIHQFSISVIGIFMTVNFSFVAGMIVCGLRIRSYIKQSALSSKAAAVHSTVFRMLIVEAAVPLFVLHIPAILLLCGPIIFTMPRLMQDLIAELALSCPVVEPLTVVIFLTRRTRVCPQKGAMNRKNGRKGICAVSFATTGAQ